MITKVIGVCLVVFSSIWMLITVFLYLNSSAYLDYNAPKITLAQAGVFFPFLVFIILFIFGVLLARDKVYEHH